jgi:cell fate regulator YaaT (PSP1 superfamily)
MANPFANPAHSMTPPGVARAGYDRAVFHATVRYGRLRHLAEFSPEDAATPPPRERTSCVVRTERGLELGWVLATHEGGERPAASKRSFLRTATTTDLDRRAALEAEVVPRARAFAIERAAKQGLPLRVVAAEQLLSGDRLFVYYTAEDRLDLRELARELQAELGTRIELRQLGARERARSCGGTGVCGRTLCCSTFLREMEPVTLRMAKVQGFSLAPEATSGACGRLKCCLRYENPLYEEGRAALPRIGAHIEAPRASGEVVSISVLERKVRLKTRDGWLIDLFAAEIATAKTGVMKRLPLAPAAPAEAPPEAPPRDAPGKKDSRWKGITKRLPRLFGRRPKDEAADGAESGPGSDRVGPEAPPEYPEEDDV